MTDTVFSIEHPAPVTIAAVAIACLIVVLAAECNKANAPSALTPEQATYARECAVRDRSDRWPDHVAAGCVDAARLLYPSGGARDE